MVKYWEEFGGNKILQWSFDNRGAFSTTNNSTWKEQQVSSAYCLKHVGCALFNLGILILQSKMWSRQFRFDLFPPYFVSSTSWSMGHEMYACYQTLFYLTGFCFRTLWDIDITQASLQSPVLVSRVQVLHVLTIPSNRLKHFVHNEDVALPWTDESEYVHIFAMTNVYFFCCRVVRDG